MADIPVLVCTAGALKGARIPVPDGGLSIGRADDNDVVLNDEGASRFHTRLLFDNGTLWCQDSGSRNGVFVNGKRLTGHQALKVGDTMEVGTHAFKVMWADEAQDAKLTPSPTMPRIEPGLSDDDSTQEAERPTSKKRWFWPFS
jgi:pSer/pThr/pTyr-binding forkhead associated (FHA) protein